MFRESDRGDHILLPDIFTKKIFNTFGRSGYDTTSTVEATLALEEEGTTKHPEMQCRTWCVECGSHARGFGSFPDSKSSNENGKVQVTPRLARKTSCFSYLFQSL